MGNVRYSLPKVRHAVESIYGSQVALGKALGERQGPISGGLLGKRKSVLFRIVNHLIEDHGYALEDLLETSTDDLYKEIEMILKSQEAFKKEIENLKVEISVIKKAIG